MSSAAIVTGAFKTIYVMTGLIWEQQSLKTGLKGNQYTFKGNNSDIEIFASLLNWVYS